MPLTSNIVGLIAKNDPVFTTNFKTDIGAYNYSTHPANTDASNDKHPSIVLVHGAFLPSNAFALLIPLLVKAGYKVLTPALPSSNTNPATLAFSADVVAIRAAIDGEIALGKEVVVVMHSYGAVVGCEAMKGIKTGVRSGEPGRSFYHLSLPEGGVVKLIFISGQVRITGYKSALSVPELWIESLCLHRALGKSVFPHSLETVLHCSFVVSCEAKKTDNSIYAGLTHRL